MLPGIGPMELIVVLVIALIGSGMREFKSSVTGGGDREELPAAEPAPAQKP